MSLLSKVKQAHASLKKHLECSICMEIPKEFWLTKCNHFFCKKCYTQLIEGNTNKCPVCNRSINRRTICMNENMSGYALCFNALTEAIEEDINEAALREQGCCFQDVSTRVLKQNSLLEKKKSTDLGKENIDTMIHAAEKVSAWLNDDHLPESSTPTAQLYPIQKATQVSTTKKDTKLHKMNSKKQKQNVLVEPSSSDAINFNQQADVDKSSSFSLTLDPTKRNWSQVTQIGKEMRQKSGKVKSLNVTVESANNKSQVSLKLNKDTISVVEDYNKNKKSNTHTHVVNKIKSTSESVLRNSKVLQNEDKRNNVKINKQIECVSLNKDKSQEETFHIQDVNSTNIENTLILDLNQDQVLDIIGIRNPSEIMEKIDMKNNDELASEKSNIIDNSRCSHNNETNSTKCSSSKQPCLKNEKKTNLSLLRNNSADSVKVTTTQNSNMDENEIATLTSNKNAKASNNVRIVKKLIEENDLVQIENQNKCNILSVSGNKLEKLSQPSFMSRCDQKVEEISSKNDLIPQNKYLTNSTMHEESLLVKRSKSSSTKLLRKYSASPMSRESINQKSTMLVTFQRLGKLIKKRRAIPFYYYNFVRKSKSKNKNIRCNINSTHNAIANDTSQINFIIQNNVNSQLADTRMMVENSNKELTNQQNDNTNILPTSNNVILRCNTKKKYYSDKEVQTVYSNTSVIPLTKKGDSSYSTITQQMTNNENNNRKKENNDSMNDLQEYYLSKITERRISGSSCDTKVSTSLSLKRKREISPTDEERNKMNDKAIFMNTDEEHNSLVNTDSDEVFSMRKKPMKKISSSSSSSCSNSTDTIINKVVSETVKRKRDLSPPDMTNVPSDLTETALNYRDKYEIFDKNIKKSKFNDKILLSNSHVNEVDKGSLKNILDNNDDREPKINFFEPRNTCQNLKTTTLDTRELNWNFFSPQDVYRNAETLKTKSTEANAKFVTPQTICSNLESSRPVELYLLSSPPKRITSNESNSKNVNNGDVIGDTFDQAIADVDSQLLAYGAVSKMHFTPPSRKVSYLNLQKTPDSNKQQKTANRSTVACLQQMQLGQSPKSIRNENSTDDDEDQVCSSLNEIAYNSKTFKYSEQNQKCKSTNQSSGRTNSRISKYNASIFKCESITNGESVTEKANLINQLQVPEKNITEEDRQKYDLEKNVEKSKKAAFHEIKKPESNKEHQITFDDSCLMNITQDQYLFEQIEQDLLESAMKESGSVKSVRNGITKKKNKEKSTSAEVENKPTENCQTPRKNNANQICNKSPDKVKDDDYVHISLTEGNPMFKIESMDQSQLSTPRMQTLTPSDISPILLTDNQQKQSLITPSASNIRLKIGNETHKTYMKKRLYHSTPKLSAKNSKGVITLHNETIQTRNEEIETPAAKKEITTKDVNESNTQQFKSTVGINLCFVCSGLTLTQIDLAKRLANKCGAKYLSAFNPEVTHVIVKTTEDNGAENTLKYLQGVAYKKWVVNFSWVIDSIKENKLLDEEKYEVLDSISREMGSRKSRLRKSDIFVDFAFLCIGPLTSILVGQCEELIQCVGGVIARSLEDLTTITGKLKIIVIQEDIHDERTIRNWHNKTKALPVILDWVTECISQYRLIPLPTYLQEVNPSEAAELGFPQQLLEDEEVDSSSEGHF